MTERLQPSPNPEKDLLQRQLGEKLLATYDGHRDFLKTLQLSHSTGYVSGYTIFAKNYASLPEEHRTLLWSSARRDIYSERMLLLRYTAAGSLAKEGDFSLADELGFQPRCRDRQVTMGIRNEIMDIAISQAKHGQDSSQAFAFVGKNITSHQSKEDNGYNLLQLASVARETGRDPSPYLTKIIDRAKKNDKELARTVKRKDSYDYRKRLATSLMGHGFFEEAIQLVGKNRFDIGQVYMLTKHFIGQRRYEDALSEAISSKMRVRVLADIAVHAAHCGMDPKKYIQEAKELLQEVPKEQWSDQELHFFVHLSLVKAEHLMGNSSHTHYAAVMERIKQEENTQEQIRLLSEVLKTQAETISMQPQTIRALMQTLDHCYSFLAQEDVDKLDRVDMLMEVEDLINSFIDLGLYDLARNATHRLSQYYDKESRDDEFLVTATARIASEELKKGLSTEEVAALSSEEVHSLLTTNNPLVHRAIGHFGLVDNEQLAQLPTQVRIAVAVGTQQCDRSKENMSGPIEIFNSERTVATARALVKSYENIDDQTSVDSLTALLEQEMNGARDVKIIGRLVKGLIEKRSERGRDIAVAIFSDETLPIHLRLYVARKLCDSGVWDRQIIDYFRNYQRHGHEDGFLMTVKLDSLTAIVNQMHVTPSLALYKVLERTRLSRDIEAMQHIADFGAVVFLLPETDLKDKLEIFSHWVDQYEEGKISVSQLEKLRDRFRTLSDAERAYYERHKIDKRHPGVISLVKSFYTHPRIESILDEVTLLLQRGYYPTGELIRFVKHHGDQAETLLKNLQEQTESGSFDPQNPVQRDMEFSRFLLSFQGDKKNAYKSFQNLEFVESEEFIRDLTMQEKMEAEAAAYEAAMLYWFVKDRVDKGRKVSVVGNRRYGDYFVVEPLRNYFEELGVQVSSYRIGSSGSGQYTVEDVFPTSFIEGLVGECPDVVVVDGTRRPFDHQNNARLSSSMNGYLNWFYAFNDAAGQKGIVPEQLSQMSDYQKLVKKIADFNPQEPYTISSYFPTPTEYVTVGDQRLPYREPDFDGPVAILANPVIVPNRDAQFPKHLSQHQPGFLDDPEQYVKEEKVIAFTRSGIGRVHKKGGDEVQFANSIQNYMVQVLPRILRSTNPLFH